MSILLCYDGSPSAKHAITVARATLGQEPLTVLHVWNPPSDVLADAFSTRSAAGAASIDELEGVALGRAQTIGEEGAKLADESGLAAEPRVERNETSVWRKILDVADEIDPALIVIGTHGVTAVQSALLGSVSNAVVHHSERPVLIVPAPPHRR